MLLDLVKAFERVPRTLLWLVMLKYGVPPKLVSLLKALHSDVKVKFSVDEVEVIMRSIIGVKQGDLLGPQLFLFLICAIMQTWRKLHNHLYDMCTFRTKMDSVVGGRRWSTGGKSGKGCTEFRMSDSEYADDTGLMFCSRADVERMAPLVIAHFRRWGMEVHERKPGAAKFKTLVLFCAAPPSEYDDPETFDGADVSVIALPSGNTIPVVAEAKYLGSMMGRDCSDKIDVAARVKAAGKAFGALSECVFRSTSISLEAKRVAFVALVLPILLYGCECWCLTQALRAKLRKFHHACCARTMCRINMWHTREYRITTASILQLLEMRSIETYVVRRQLQWAGHVARMGEERLPRKHMTAWCYQARPEGRPEYTYGAGLSAALEYAGVEEGTWMERAGAGAVGEEMAECKLGWKEVTKGIREKAARQEPHPALLRRAVHKRKVPPLPPPPPPPPPQPPAPPLPEITASTRMRMRTRGSTSSNSSSSSSSGSSSSNINNNNNNISSRTRGEG